jgi:hypothetical protein
MVLGLCFSGSIPILPMFLPASCGRKKFFGNEVFHHFLARTELSLNICCHQAVASWCALSLES